MTEKTKSLKDLPPHITTMIEQDSVRMHQITMLTRQALDGESNIYNFAVFKTLSTVANINLWKQMSKFGDENPEAEAWFENCMKNYLSEMEKLPQIASEKITRILEGVSHKWG